jgi:hypothetical protein
MIEARRMTSRMRDHPGEREAEIFALQFGDTAWAD